MKLLCYHGTTADHLESILQNGLRHDAERKVWSVSDDAIYFWGRNYVENEYSETYDEDTQDEYHNSLISLACDSAMCALAKSRDCRAVVVVFELDVEEHEDDNSCENMSAANCVGRSIQLGEIKEILVSQDLSLLRGYFVGLMVDRPYYNGFFTPLELSVGRAMRELPLDDVMDFIQFNNVQVPVLS
jgi:hypothetical protein